MGTTTLLSLAAVLFAIVMPGGSPTARFFFFADALMCIPTRAAPLRLPLPRHGSSKHGCISSSLSIMASTNLFPSSLFTASPTCDVSTAETSFDPDRDDRDRSDDLYFIRPAMFVDMDRSSKILADGFFKGPKTNWFTYQYEKFITYLSLEANFPTTQQQRSRYEIFVACCKNTGEVWGIVEIDARGTNGPRTTKVYAKSGGSSYMCNLAVDEKHKRKGIASSLVYECERQVREWYQDEEANSRKRDEETTNNTDDFIYNSKNEMIGDIFSIGNDPKKNPNKLTNSICLKVRESNKAAVQMYTKLGYFTIFDQIEDKKTGENILLMQNNFPSDENPSSASTSDEEA
eukprot:CAMPEP_0201192894 /NCGR_PEP_ID=MMETSP0851-20130426/145605_1 /ASSEMBLY_ACC=CAM_ASM_000631 /TAXON_ID=183588 /ORGANISM="Pseudo-nitzschia fraudulenta, Strain WWA7" /LENGTH=345 /DNA_ID=CAMNT_0047479285 /DNA_START=16 /DNA_END=1053 /DNA_ORIENTATION=-